MKQSVVVAFAGNPNVGKSTLFNSLTGMRQHTGNWPGKTVEKAEADIETDRYCYHLIDLPGTYSLKARSLEEIITQDYLSEQNPDITMVVCDASCLQRNLKFLLQVMEISSHVILCVNLMDEAKKRGIIINLEKLSEILGIVVIGTCAHKRNTRKEIMSLLDQEVGRQRKRNNIKEKDIESICQKVIEKPEGYDRKDRQMDKIFTSIQTGFLSMILLFTLIFWITLTGANYISDGLADGMDILYGWIGKLLTIIEIPEVFYDFLMNGVLKVMFWVISVMLPPMAVFFPLFSVLEDSGYLPRMAYNLDCPLKKCGGCGKQALTMSMGLGCNAVGVTGCRIIDSPRERLIAVLTNSFIPCNGRFPAMITVITIFFSGFSQKEQLDRILFVVILAGFIILSILLTFFVSKILSLTILKGISSFFMLELPPYRKPQMKKILVRSVFDRTLYMLRRAVIVSVPAGAILWIMINVKTGNITLMKGFIKFLEPLGHYIGLDGTILAAFLLGFPANEIVIPIMIMGYLQNGTLEEISNLRQIYGLLVQNGWNLGTAVCFLVFTISHWPCATTLYTIWKEEKKIRWVIWAVIIPAMTGMSICLVIHTIMQVVI
ncbi:ferrous iron transporter B [Anaerostipes sp. 494a]|uniref:ferrous iron transporter B n=1 Tax=Anaerostipes sp. 494a TaxID=1261636 RepID=UPI0009FAD07E|nr:ferrous iron transporter B [Anaerostipes sp. 494a]